MGFTFAPSHHKSLTVASQPQHLHEIEHTMALFAFENQSESPLGHLLGQAQRRLVADEVNSAILRSQKQELGEWGGAYLVSRLSIS
jgi:hypothetical protein